VKTTSPPCSPGLGPQVDDVIAFFDDLRIMLDNNYGVLVGAEPLKNFDESSAVAWMQADGRLIEHIKRID
jgi:hypothetical protein